MKVDGGLKADWLVIPGAVFIGLAFIVPLGLMIDRSFSGGALANYGYALTAPHNLRSITYTLEVTALVVGLCILLGYPWAWLMTRASRLGQMVMMAIVLVPFWSSLLVRSYAWTVILRDSGIVNQALALISPAMRLQLMGNTTGTVIGMTQICLPFMILPVYAAMLRLDGNLLFASESLGARPLTTFLRVYFPLTLPGVIAGSVLVLVVSLGFYITPTVLGHPYRLMISQLVVNEAVEMISFGTASAMAVVLLILTLLMLALVGRFVPVFQQLGLDGAEERN